MTWIGASPASAHTPVISADCAGVHVKATAYDAGQQNKWSVTIGGVTQSGTFGASFDQTFAVPQDGATTSWSANVSAADGGFPGQGSGSVGPCGTPPPPTDVCVDLPGDQPDGTSCTPPADVVRADSKALEGCDVTFGGTTYGAGELTYDEQYTDTHVFNTTTNTWDLVTDTTASVANVEFTPWSVQEQVANGCTEPTNQPPAVESSHSSNNVSCADDSVVTTTVSTTTPYVYDAETNEWVLGEAQVETTTSQAPVESGVCPETGVLSSGVTVENTGVENNLTPAVPSKVQVPTYVDAGLGSDTAAPVLSAAASAAPAAPSSGSSMPALLLLMGAALVLVGGMRLSRS